jgi:hypothetical protein
MIRLLPILCAVAAGGCAGMPDYYTAQFEWRPSSSVPQVQPGKYPNAPAVVLERIETRSILMNVGLRMSLHETIAILSPAGLEEALVRVPAVERVTNLQYLKARTIDPDGTVTEVTPEQIRDETMSGSAADGFDEVRVFKVFRFPRVKVGSRVEYAYAIDFSFVPSFVSERVGRPLPVVFHRVEITIPKTFSHAIRIHNAPGTKLDVVRDSETKKLSFEFHDVPSHTTESLAPPWQLIEPWWALRTPGMHFGVKTTRRFDSWQHAVADDGRWLYQSGLEWAKATPISIDVKACGADRRCKVQRAFEFVRDKAPLSAFSSVLKRRDLKDVLASRHADSVEKTMLLWAALRSVGVDGRFALTNRSRGLLLEHDFPAPDRRDHVILQLAREPGSADPLYLDPSCESCAVGQIPDWIEGREALVLTNHFEAASGNDLDTEFDRVVGASSAPSLIRHVIEVQLKPGGDATGSFIVESSGRDAVDDQIETRNWQRDRWREEMAKLMNERVPSARLGLVVPQVCDRENAACRAVASWSAPGYGVEDGDILTVPLNWLDAGNLTERPREPRRNDVFVDRAHRIEDRLVFHLPPGYAARDLPKAVNLETPAGAVTLEAEAQPGVVTVRRSLTFHPGDYPPEAWNALIGALDSYEAMRKLQFIARKARSAL